MFILDSIYSLMPASFKEFYRAFLKSYVKRAKALSQVPHKKTIELYTYLKMLTDAYFKDYCVFPSGAITPNIPLIQKYWKQLNRGAEHEIEAKAWVSLIRSHSMVSYDSCLAMANIVKYCEDNRLPGRFVETGTWKGGSLAFLAKAHMVWGHKQRELWGFDSFEGIPEPHAEHDPMDWAEQEMKIKTEDCGGRLRSINALVAAEDDVYEIMERIQFPRENLKLFKGWFQDTLPRIKDEEIGDIAILRLDGDLYESTLVCLEKFEPHVINGGFVIIDDWGLAGAQKAVIEYYTKKYGKMPFVHFIDQVSRYIQVNR